MKIGTYELQVPFVTTGADNVKIVMSLAEVDPGMKIIDLGPGDGRVVLEFAKRGGIVHGFEIKPELVERSRKRIADAGLSDQAIIFEKSFWDIDLSQYDLIYIYGMQSVLGRLEQKLEKEMKPGAKFISNIFRLPNWRVKKTKETVHLYIR